MVSETNSKTCQTSKMKQQDPQFTSGFDTKMIWQNNVINFIGHHKDNFDWDEIATLLKFRRNCRVKYEVSWGFATLIIRCFYSPLFLKAKYPFFAVGFFQ